MKNILFALFLFFLTFGFSSCADDNDLYVQQKIQESQAQADFEDDISDNTTPESGVSFWDGFLILVVTVGLAGLIVWFFVSMVPLKLWFNAKLSKVNVSWLLLIKMRWQNIPQAKIINLMVTAKNANLTLDLPILMKYYLAKVDLEVVVTTMIRALAANVKAINFEDMQNFISRK